MANGKEESDYTGEFVGRKELLTKYNHILYLQVKRASCFNSCQAQCLSRPLMSLPNFQCGNLQLSQFDCQMSVALYLSHFIECFLGDKLSVS